MTFSIKKDLQDTTPNVLQEKNSDAGTLSKINKAPSLEETVYHRIKQAIINATILPGTPLVETQLAEELGVSRTPIRKTLARLETEGFVVASPTQGYNVTEISPSDSQELWEFRAILECHLIRVTVPLFTAEEIDEMESIIVAADKALEENDLLGFLSVNRDFHHIFDKKHGNKRISDHLNNIDDHVTRRLLYEFKIKGSIQYNIYTGHRLIIDAIRAGDADSVASLMWEHLTTFWSKDSTIIE